MIAEMSFPGYNKDGKITPGGPDQETIKA